MRKQALARKESYQKTFKKYGTDPKALQWRNGKSAEVRYHNLIAGIDFEKKKVLDIGCGFGDIIPFIEAKTKDFKYLGIDIVPEFIKEAKKKHPEHSFLVGDWMELIKRHDIVLCSGVLNNKVKADQYEYRKEAISLMYKNAEEVLAFNMAGSSPQPRNKKKYKVYYADSLKILKYCLDLTRKIIFRHQYNKKCFTIVMFKEEE